MFISPIVDMEKLILNIMIWSNVTEEELHKEKVIETSFGETLSWEYLSYARTHPIIWEIPTNILYAANDNMVSLETMTEFAKKNPCKPNGYGKRRTLVPHRRTNGVLG